MEKYGYGFAKCRHNESNKEWKMRIKVVLGMTISVSAIKLFPRLLHIRAALNQDELLSQTATGSKKSLETQQFGLKIPFLKLGIKGGWGEGVRDLVGIQIYTESAVTKERKSASVGEEEGRETA